MYRRIVVPLITGKRERLRERLLIEEEGQRYYMGFPDRVRLRTVMTDRYRLSLYDGVPWGELYDLREDPDELVNRWDDRALAGVRAELTARLLDEVMQTESRLPPRVAPN